MKQSTAIVCAMLLILFGISIPSLASSSEPALEAEGAVLLDMHTLRVLSGKNAHTRLPMASTTKVMTALVALENGALNAIVKVPATAYKIEGSSMHLKNGEELTLEDLLYGLMLSSGNDAAVTIAIHIGGSVEGFAQMMNDRATKIGCTNTNFVTPNGLPHEQHYTSAYDLALITAEAMKNPQFQTIVGTQYWETKTGNAKRTLKNSNKLLWNYNGGNGVKTGFTKAAGKCLVFSAERSGNTLIGVVLHCSSTWQEATTLLDYGFARHTWQRYATAGEVEQRIAVGRGMKNTLDLLVKEDILVPLREGEGKEAVQLRVSCPSSIDAPVYAGQQVGSIEVWADGKVLQTVPLVAAESIAKKAYGYFLEKFFREFIAS